MKKKPVPKGDESDASDAVDEPEEVSDDDGAKRRSSGRLRGAKKPRLAEPESSEGEDEENEDDEEEPDEEDDEENDDEEESGGDSEEEYKTDQVKRKKKQNGSARRGRPPARRDSESDEVELDESGVAKEFTSGAYVVLKTDFANGGNPPIWKIDGKALLQKYIPFEQDGKTLYKNTSTYSGWSTGNKDNYHSAPIVYKTQNRKETIVEFLRDSIKVDAAAPAAAAEDDDPSATEQ